MKKSKLPKRTIPKFTLGENVECYLCSAKLGEYSKGNFKYRYIDVVHGTVCEDIREDRPEGSTIKKFLKQRVFFPHEFDLEKIKSRAWELSYMLRVAGYEDWSELAKINPDDYVGYLEGVVEHINSAKGKEYYLKTRFVKTRNDSLVINVGEMPYVSNSPDLSYFGEEDKYNYLQIS